MKGKEKEAAPAARLPTQHKHKGNSHLGVTEDPAKDKPTEKAGCDLGDEVVDIRVAKEKGGVMFFKYTLYVVRTKQAEGARILRRFSEFEWLRALLCDRYPFRVIPPLPQKHIADDAFFIEDRRRGLTKFLDSVLRHPVLAHDDLVVYFLSEPIPEHLHQKMKTLTVVEEFHSSEVAHQHPRKHIPENADELLRALEARLPILLAQFSKTLVILEHFVHRNSRDSLDFSTFGGLFE